MEKLEEMLSIRLSRYGTMDVDAWVAYVARFKISEGMARKAIRALERQGLVRRSGGVMVPA